MRVIVASSREWPAPSVVVAALEACMARAIEKHDKLIVVHGHSRVGAERTADEWTMRAAGGGDPVGWPERHSAWWDGPCRDRCKPGHRKHKPGKPTTCPNAGFYRNEDMIEAGAEMCLLFVVKGSDALIAEHLAAKAREAGIDVQPFRL